MARTINQLDDVELRRWVKAGGPLAKSDGLGLTFTLSAAGAAVWVLRYRHGGRRREVKIGTYPDISLKDARQRAAKLRAEVADGTDVALARQREKAAQRAAWTVPELVRDFREKVVPGLAATTATCWTGYLDNTFLPRFRSFLAAEVSTNDVQDWLTAVAAERGYHAANNARKVALALFKHACTIRVCAGNPTEGINVAALVAGGRPSTRKRVALSGPEIHHFLAGMDMLAEVDAIAFRLLLMTGVRVGELRGAEWIEVDMDAGTWRIPRGRIKTRKFMVKDHDHFEIALPRQAVADLRRLKDLSCGSRYLLPGRHLAQPADHEAMLRRLATYTRRLEGCQEIVLHDLRSTFRSGLTKMLKVRIEVAERALNHRLGGLVEIYDPDAYQVERAEALQQWADLLDRLRQDPTAAERRPSASVTALRSAA